MQLTSKQIDEIKGFVHGKHILWIDLQNELIDHIATEIEKEWDENPRLEFETIFKSLYKKYDHFHFQFLVKEHKKKLKEQISKEIEKETNKLFKPPLLFATLGVFFVNYLIMRYANHAEWYWKSVLGLEYLWAFAFLFKMYIDYYKLKRKYGYVRYLDEPSVFIFSIVMIPILIMYTIPIWEKTENDWKEGTSIFFTFYSTTLPIFLWATNKIRNKILLSNKIEYLITI